MATIIKRPSGYCAQVFKKGIRRSQTFKTKTAAQEWAKRIETEITAGKIAVTSELTFADAIRRYGEEVSTTKRGEKWEVVRLNMFRKLPFVYDRIADITTADIAQWRDTRLAQVSSGSVRRELNLISCVFEQARREWQWIDANPCRDVKKPRENKSRARIFSQAEIDRLCEYLGDESPTRSAVLLAVETGMRRSELIGLAWDNIFLDRRFLTLETTKNGDSRGIPLSTKAVEVLSGLQHQERPFLVSADAITRTFYNACKAIGIEEAHFHDTRATALTRLSKKLNVLELARVVGHRDTRSLMIYYRESAENIAAKLD